MWPIGCWFAIAIAVDVDFHSPAPSTDIAEQRCEPTIEGTAIVEFADHERGRVSSRFLCDECLGERATEASFDLLGFVAQCLERGSAVALRGEEPHERELLDRADLREELVEAIGQRRKTNMLARHLRDRRAVARLRALMLFASAVVAELGDQVADVASKLNDAIEPELPVRAPANARHCLECVSSLATAFARYAHDAETKASSSFPGLFSRLGWFVFVRDDDAIAFDVAACRDEPAERRDELTLDVATEGPRSVCFAVSTFGEVGECCLRDREIEATLDEPTTLRGAVGHDPNHLTDVFLAERVERHDAIDAIDELGSERLADDLHVVTFVATLAASAVIETGGLRVAVGCAEVRGKDDDGVVEPGRLAAAVGEATFAADLKEEIEGCRIGLLDLVEEDHGEGLLANLAREQALASIRAAEEAFGGMSARIFAHVEANQAILAAKEQGRERAGELGFAHTGRADEEERGERFSRRLQACFDHANELGDAPDSFVLSDETSP